MLLRNSEMPLQTDKIGSNLVIIRSVGKWIWVGFVFSLVGCITKPSEPPDRLKIDKVLASTAEMAPDVQLTHLQLWEQETKAWFQKQHAVYKAQSQELTLREQAVAAQEAEWKSHWREIDARKDQLIHSAFSQREHSLKTWEAGLSNWQDALKVREDDLIQRENGFVQREDALFELEQLLNTLKQELQVRELRILESEIVLEQATDILEENKSIVEMQAENRRLAQLMEETADYIAQLEQQVMSYQQTSSRSRPPMLLEDNSLDAEHFCTDRPTAWGDEAPHTTRVQLKGGGGIDLELPEGLQTQPH